MTTGQTVYSDSDSLLFFYNGRLTEPQNVFHYPGEREGRDMRQYPKGALLGNFTGKEEMVGDVNMLQVHLTFDHPFYGAIFGIGTRWESIEVDLFFKESDLSELSLKEQKAADAAKAAAEFSKQLEGAKSGGLDPKLTGSPETAKTGMSAYLIAAVLVFVAGLVGFTLWQRSKKGVAVIVPTAVVGQVAGLKPKLQKRR